MDQFFASARAGLGTGLIDLDTAVLKASVCRGYTYNAAHTFVSEAVAAGASLVSTQTLTGVSFVDGVLDANDPTFASVAAGAGLTSVLLFQASGVTGGADVAQSAQRLIAVLDGKFRFTVAAGASSGATTMAVDALDLAIASGAVATLISGSGPSTITLASAAAAGARSLSVSALGSTLSADAVYEVAYAGSNWPITPNGGDISLTWSNGPNKILRI